MEEYVHTVFMSEKKIQLVVKCSPANPHICFCYYRNYGKHKQRFCLKMQMDRWKVHRITSHACLNPTNISWKLV